MYYYILEFDLLNNHIENFSVDFSDHFHLKNNIENCF